MDPDVVEEGIAFELEPDGVGATDLDFTARLQKDVNGVLHVVLCREGPLGSDVVHLLLSVQLYLDASYMRLVTCAPPNHVFRLTV